MEGLIYRLNLFFLLQLYSNFILFFLVKYVFNGLVVFKMVKKEEVLLKVN